MIGRHAGINERRDAERCIPSRRQARLEMKVFGLFYPEAVNRFNTAFDVRVMIGITERVKGEQRIEHRRNDACPIARRVLPLNDPSLGGFNRALTKWHEARAVSQLEYFVGGDEERAGSCAFRVLEFDVGTLAAAFDKK